MAKPLKSTRADRRLKENKNIPPYTDKNTKVKNTRKSEDKSVEQNKNI